MGQRRRAAPGRTERCLRDDEGPHGIYAAWVSLPNDFAPVIGPAVVKLDKGIAYQVYAWGDGTSGYDFAVVALPVGIS